MTKSWAEREWDLERQYLRRLEKERKRIEQLPEDERKALEDKAKRVADKLR